MILIYYRDNDGKIVRHHLPHKDMTPEQLAAAMEEFNERGDTKVYAQEIEEGSLEMYLWECAQKQKRFTEETVQAARDAIREALDCIDCLEVAK